MELFSGTKILSDFEVFSGIEGVMPKGKKSDTKVCAMLILLRIRVLSWKSI